MRVTQGTFSYLPARFQRRADRRPDPLCLQSTAGRSRIEYTDDPHPRNTYWELWGLPVFDTKEEDSENILREVRAAREAFPEHYIKVLAYDPTYTRQTTALADSSSTGRRSRSASILDRIQGPGRVNRVRLAPDERTPANGATNGAAG